MLIRLLQAYTSNELMDYVYLPNVCSTNSNLGRKFQSFTLIHLLSRHAPRKTNKITVSADYYPNNFPFLDCECAKTYQTQVFT